jgi:predicted outer membrane protein
VKKFGERMVTDHSKANDDLKAIAEKRLQTAEQGAKRKVEIR